VVFVTGNRLDEDLAKGPTKALGIGQRAPNCDLVNGCLGRRGHRFRPRQQRGSWHHRRGHPPASGHGRRRLDEGQAREEGIGVPTGRENPRRNRTHISSGVLQPASLPTGLAFPFRLGSPSAPVASASRTTAPPRPRARATASRTAPSRILPRSPRPWPRSPPPRPHRSAGGGVVGRDRGQAGSRGGRTIRGGGDVDGDGAAAAHSGWGGEAGERTRAWAGERCGFTEANGRCRFTEGRTQKGRLLLLT
jgi:hypothetical protein